MRIERLAGVVVGALAAAGCGSGAQAPPSVVEQAQRVVVMAPAAAEMVVELGAADSVVGVGDFVSGLAPLAELPRVGAYNAPNAERVLELRANLFLTAASAAAAESHRRLEALGIAVVPLDTSTHDGVFVSLATIGRLLGREERARALAREMRQRIAAIRRTATDLPRRRVLFVVGRDPLFVAGPGSHIDEMIGLVGGVNVLADALSPYERASLEVVLERLPEIIIDCSDNRRTAARGRDGGDWSRWEFLPAVQRGRVYQVEPSRLVIPGIRLPEMTLLMGKLVQPEAFGEPAPSEMGQP